ncbi:MAG: cupin domain-containing protein [Gammaproteobacteria bacterium]|jgi:50S ribosomal protein L16 3-hydroxylase
MPTSRQKTSDARCHPPFPGDITVEIFLQEYWQKKPLLIRNAFPGINSPLTPDELAGLACEEDANSRIVFEQHEQGHWHVLHGPLHEDDFNDLPERNWTLLVTDVEKHVPAARQLIDHFRFIPDWRIDDLMISYAPEGGSVGPHTDAYDVFLIQTHGQRRWMINKDYDPACLDDTELRILKHFNASEDWMLNPGDMLYLPPDIAHYGIAVNECMTCSVGFRAPSVSNMVSEYAEALAAGIAQEQRYEDPDLGCQQHPAEISHQALVRIRSMLNEQLKVNDESIKQWFGKFSSESRSGTHPCPPDRKMATYDDLIALLSPDAGISQSPVAKFLFCRTDNAALLFVDGTSYETSRDFAITLTDERDITYRRLIRSIAGAADQQVLLELYNNGYVLIDE